MIKETKMKKSFYNKRDSKETKQKEKIENPSLKKKKKLKFFLPKKKKKPIRIESFFPFFFRDGKKEKGKKVFFKGTNFLIEKFRKQRQIRLYEKHQKILEYSKSSPLLN